LQGGEATRSERIGRVSREEPLPLSYAQQRLWFLDQLEPGNPFYNIPLAVRLRGELQPEILEQSLNEIIRRHEVLRMSFVNEGGRAVQVVAAELQLRWGLTDLVGLSEAEQAEALAAVSRAEATAPFDLSRGPLLRARLLRLEEREHVALLTLHHIVSDGWSMGVLVREVASLYESYSQGVTAQLPELGIQYADYAVWQREWLESGVLEEQLEYWKEQLRDAPAVLDLPTDRARPAVQSYRGGREELQLSEELSAGLRELSRREGVTLFMTLLAAFQTLLYRYTGQREIVVGSPIAGRTRMETEGLIGLFVNTLALRSEVDGEARFVDLLQQVREVTLRAHAHQDLPFERLVEELEPERALSHAPLFQVLFALQNAPQEQVDLPGLSLTALPVETGASKFDLVLVLAETDGRLAGVIKYAVDLFEAQTIRRMMDHFKVLLSAIVSDPGQRLALLQLITSQEETNLAISRRAPHASDSYPQLLVHQLFAAQARRVPEAIALVHKDKTVTYRELDQQSNQLAHYLQSRGVGPEVLVGIYLERSAEVIEAILAVMKAGGCYLPLDPAYPPERLRFMIEDAGLNLVITDAQHQTELPATVEAILLPDAGMDEAAWPRANPVSPVAGENLVYVLYTSGSTGRPKGVAIEHRQLRNYLLAVLARLGPVPEGSRFATVSTFAADLGHTMIFPALCSGSTLHIIPQEVVMDAEALGRHLDAAAIDYVKIVPSHCQTVLASSGSEVQLARRRLISGGEALDWNLVSRLQRQMPQCAIMNHYGPTETTVGCLTYDVGLSAEQTEGQVALGKALENVHTLVLDSAQQLVPTGVRGELYIGGAGVGRGYLGRAELTAERFIPDAYSGVAGARLYRTGDVARYQADGNIEYLGRVDGQVKFLGHRVELGEIRHLLNTHPQVRNSVVVLRRDGRGNQLLVAYYVARQELPVNELRELLGQSLMRETIPNLFVHLKKLPLTINGKINYEGLPEVATVREQQRRAPVGPRTPTEELLCGIWGEVLSVKTVGVDDNFFELGGHSLLATQVISRVRAAFGIELRLRSLFERPNLRGLAAVVDTAVSSGKVIERGQIERVSHDGPLPLSFAQQRLWFLDQLEPGSPFYNIPVAVRLQGELQLEVLENSLTEIIRRHEVLRTSFPDKNGEPYQQVNDCKPIKLALVDLRGLTAEGREAEVARLRSAETRRPFDLSAGPLLRARLLRLEEKEHVALLTLHHIVSDGWSMGVLVREVASLYESYSQGVTAQLPELGIQYADYAVWQREWLESGVLEEQLEYWKEQLRGAPAVLELPTDRARPAVQSYRGGRERFELSAELSVGLRELSRREGVTLFMTLLAAFQTLLYRYTGQRDIPVGSPIAGRTRVETEELIGFFVNTLVLRSKLDAEVRFVDLLRQVREVTLGAHAHQDLPFERLVEELAPERALSHAPLFQVLFVLQNAPQEQLELPGLSLTALPVETGTAKFDLSLSLVETGEGLRGTVEYDRDLLEAESVQRLVGHFEQLLQSIVKEPERQLWELELLGAAERQELLAQSTGAVAPEVTESLAVLFGCQVAARPEATAVVYEAERLSYRELDERGNQVAQRLRRMGVGAETIVGLCMPRSLELIVGLLGIVKAGGAYLPLDGSYPEERLRYMVADADARVVLTSTAERERVGQWGVKTLCLDQWEEFAEESVSAPASETTAANLAYVMYTSGSTGKPKGVCVTHSAITRLVLTTNYITLTEDDRIAQISNASFDAATFEIWGALLNGATLVGIAQQVVLSPIDLAREINQRQISALFMTTALFNQVVREAPHAFANTKHVLVGGEAAEPRRIREALQQGPPERLVNAYGPTESTTFATWFEIQSLDTDATTVPIGKAVSRTDVYVLDQHFQPVPIGIHGELFIGGEGLARCYLNEPALTAARFVANPLGTTGDRLYRTGDQVRMLSSGDLEFIGRRDQQIKLRGFRIELSEIETVLSGHADIAACAVVATGDTTNSRRLVAYVTTTAAAILKAADLRIYLKEKLPDYMIPSTFIQLEALPLNANGKVDRRALAAHEAERSDIEREYAGPTTPTEELLCEIWSEVLRKERISIHDNFFEIGGHSLLATQVISRMRQAFSVQVPLRKLFESPTVSSLAASIEFEVEDPQDELAKIAQILEQLDQFSDDEVQNLTRKKSGTVASA